MSIVPALYSRGTGFVSRPRDWLPKRHTDHFPQYIPANSNNDPYNIPHLLPSIYLVYLRKSVLPVTLHKPYKQIIGHQETQELITLLQHTSVPYNDVAI